MRGKIRGEELNSKLTNLPSAASSSLPVGSGHQMFQTLLLLSLGTSMERYQLPAGLNGGKGSLPELTRARCPGQGVLSVWCCDISDPLAQEGHSINSVLIQGSTTSLLTYGRKPNPSKLFDIWINNEK